MDDNSIHINFISPLDEFWTCIICFDYLKKPYHTQCCHQLLCEDCLFSWLKQKNECPQCRAHLTYKGCFRDLTAQKFVYSRKCTCFIPNCEWNGELFDLINHLSHCMGTCDTKHLYASKLTEMLMYSEFPPQQDQTYEFVRSLNSLLEPMTEVEIESQDFLSHPRVPRILDHDPRTPSVVSTTENSRGGTREGSFQDELNPLNRFRFGSSHSDPSPRRIENAVLNFNNFSFGDSTNSREREQHLHEISQGALSISLESDSLLSNGSLGGNMNPQEEEEGYQDLHLFQFGRNSHREMEQTLESSDNVYSFSNFSMESSQLGENTNSEQINGSSPTLKQPTIKFTTVIRK